jgi:mono/diheme cytochrome c family protein
MRSSLAAAATALLGVATLMPAQAIDIQDFDLIQRGRYLADVGDCGACHTPPGSSALLAGGRPLDTPFGTLLAPNITPDPDTGIGAWTDDEFVNALTKGTGRNGTHLYPAMPYTYMTKITSEDALAIRAYLNAIPVVRNSVQPNQLPFPFDVRAGLVAWNALNFRPGEFQPVAGKNIAAPISSRAWRIVDSATRQKIRLAATRLRSAFRATCCRAGSRPTSPTTGGAASATGRSTTS